MDELTIEHLAEVLQEPKIPLLRQILRTLGPARTIDLLTEALQVEAAGGMLTKDGSRRRTPGGVFFQLVKERVTAKERRRLFPRPAAQHTRALMLARPHTSPQLLTWDEVLRIIETLATGPVGEARTMKLTLIGRPGQVETRGQVVVFRIQGKPPATLPRGLPPVPNTAPMTWNVMVALRQWNRVKDSLATNQDDQLIVEGYPAMQGTQHVLLAQSCTSVALQRAQKQAQSQARSTDQS
jgi:hypothetical protein